MSGWFDPFDREDRDEAALAAHAEALAAIDMPLLAGHIRDVVSRHGAHLPDVAGHEATIVPAVEREMFRLAAERRRVALGLARLRARDPWDLAMLDWFVLQVTATVAAAQAIARKPLRKSGPDPIFPSEPD